MSNVFLNVIGDGTATTNVVPPLVDGEEIIIYCTPDPGATLDDVRVWDSHDYSIAVTVSPEIHIIYDESWNNLYVDIYFSGAPIPPPEPPTPARKYPWLFAIMQKKSYKKGGI